MTPTPDYGEPWSEQSPPHPIARDKGVYWLNPEQFNRAVACVNACAGIDDPEKEIAAMREALKEAANSLEDWHLLWKELRPLTSSRAFLDGRAVERAATIVLTKLKPYTTP